MIRIRRIYNTATPGDRDAIAQVGRLFRTVFPTVPERADLIPDQLDHPFKFGYRTILLVAYRTGITVTGFALVNHFPESNSSFLDFLATGTNIRSAGFGGALYEAVREHLQHLGSSGLYVEVLPDDPDLVRNKEKREENRRRLGFYRRYGAYPITGTDYETPIDDDPPARLLFDGLGRTTSLSRSECRAAIRHILTGKYERLLPPGYIERVVESVIDDPVRLEKPEGIEIAKPPATVASKLEKSMVFVYSEAHQVHHVQERGYVERPARVVAIRKELLDAGMFDEIPARRYPEKVIREVHDGDFVDYLKAVCEKLSPDRPVYPYVFPVRRPDRRPKDLYYRAGYYCIDTFTPLDHNAFAAARNAVNVALTGAEQVLEGRPVAYALCRPPGHHAESRLFGGFCYFNNAAIAANLLSKEGRVAMIDVDYHHGNGTQSIFWRRSDVLTVSIHGHPRTSYPFFSGFSDETGEEEGKGFNRNYPLEERCGSEAFFGAFGKAIAEIRHFSPDFLVVPLGFDTMRGDPTGSFDLRPRDLEQIGHDLAGIGVPMLVVQEGGYSLGNLRSGARMFTRGISRVLANRLM